MKINKIITLLLGSSLLFGAVGCDNARTSADAPNSVDENVAIEDPGQVEETLEDANSEVRQEQLTSDIRAREQRNDIVGDQEERTDADIESEVRAKLEANIPRAKLTVEAEEGNVTIVGAVPSEKEYNTVKGLAQEITGVNDVTMDIQVNPTSDS